jgi:hypothetical protein
MATKLEKNVRKIIDYHGGMVVNRGGVRGCAHRRAKQVWYAVIKIDDAD